LVVGRGRSFFVQSEQKLNFINRPQSSIWRKAVFQVHLWTGLFLAIYVVTISLSGSVLVFQRELSDDTPRRVQAEPVVAPPNYNDIVSIAIQAHPNEHLESIDLRTKRSRIIPVGLTGPAGPRTVYVDSLERRVARDVLTSDAHPCLRFLSSLHTELLVGREGAVINGVGGLLLVFLGTTGFVLWWPGRRRWRRSLKVQWGANWKRVNWDMHSAFGFWTLLFVLMWSATGAYFIWPQAVRDAVAKVAPMEHFREIPSHWSQADPVRTPSEFITLAQERYPQSQLAYLYMDVYRHGGVVKVFLSPDPSQALTLQEQVVTFQPATAEVLSDIATSRLTVAERLSLALYSIHLGDFGGLPVKIIWSIIGASPALLAITGALMWWNRVLRKKARLWFRLP
jgi:uncharacterized iron-regulated membrane protein